LYCSRPQQRNNVTPREVQESSNTSGYLNNTLHHSCPKKQSPEKVFSEENVLNLTYIVNLPAEEYQVDDI
jgi:hypothetical protein